MTKLFSNKKAKDTVFILLFSIIFIQIATLSLYASFLDLSQHQFNPKQQTALILRLVHLTQQMPSKKLHRITTPFHDQPMNITVSDKPLQQANHINKATPINVYTCFKDRQCHKRVSIAIDAHRWLNITTKPPKGLIWFIIAFGSTALILIIALISLCLWSVKRLIAPFEKLAFATRQASGNIHSIKINPVDSPEIDQFIDRFNQIQSRLQRLLNDRTQMLAAISHDLRTPITRLKLRAEDIEKPELYKKIIADLDEMQDMISAVLAFTRDDAKKEMHEDFDINALLDTICSDMQDTGYDVTLITPEKQIPFYGNISTLRRAFTNLIDNAVKYGHSALVKLVQKDDDIIITIEDEGPGIPEKDLDKVLEPFYRIEQSRSRQTGGMGLGLTIARDIILSHQGNMTLKNKPQGGLKIQIGVTSQNRTTSL